MRRRHPHLFDLGDAEPWERIKRKERQGRTLAGITPPCRRCSWPSGCRSARRRSGSTGPMPTGPAAKVREELAEVEAELGRPVRVARRGRTGRPERAGPAPSDALVEEIGDLLFAVVNLARKAGVQPGPALDGANRKFRDRFEEVERLAEARGIELHGGGTGDAGRACGMR